MCNNCGFEECDGLGACSECNEDTRCGSRLCETCEHQYMLDNESESDVRAALSKNGIYY